MNDHATKRTIYVLAAISVLLFVVSIWYEGYANCPRHRLHTFDPPKISTERGSG
jgi:hypothetical protein